MNSRAFSSRVPIRQLMLACVSGVVALALCEVMVRLVAPRAEEPPAAVFTTSPHVRLDDHGAVRHIPNETVRTVAIFGDTVEFDFTARTNSRGFVDHREYPASATSGRRHFAFVGDSFTYGMGADPWVPRLRDRLQSAGHPIEIYNLGLSGASIQHFRKLLSSAALELPITDIVAIAITNDFYRPWWVPVTTAQGVQTCRDNGQCGEPIETISLDASIPELMARARQTWAEAELKKPVEPLWKRALWQSELYLLARRRVRDVITGFVPLEEAANSFKDPRRLAVNVEALAGIRADFPDLPITLAHFPQKNEVEAGEYELDVAAIAAQHGMDYFPALTRCEWSLDKFYVRDAHPTAAGYRHFADCLSEFLLGPATSTGAGSAKAATAGS